MLIKDKLSLLFKYIFKNHQRTIIFSLVALMIVFIGWYLINNQKQQTQYQTAKVERGTIVSTVSASGQVLSVNIISANTKTSGLVKEVFVQDGDHVKRGDKILEINLDLQGQQKYASAWSGYLSAKNTLESAKVTQYTLQADMFTKWDTFKELAESSTYSDVNSSNRNLPEFHIPQKQWLAAEAKYKNQEAEIAQAQTAINNAWLSYLLVSPVITAPADGIITSLGYVKGMSIGSLDTGNTTSNQKIATIKTPGTPIVSVNLSEIDVAKVQLSQKTTITLDSISDKTFTGKVVTADRIGTTSNNVTSYPANIQLDTESEQILPNMAVNANIIIDTKNDVLLVPSTAVQTQAGESWVIVIKNGQTQQLSVQTGISSDTQTEIVSCLVEGDEVVTGTVTPSAQQTGRSIFGAGFGGGGVIRGEFRR